jgi:hypothetical protein
MGRISTIVNPSAVIRVESCVAWKGSNATSASSKRFGVLAELLLDRVEIDDVPGRREDPLGLDPARIL